MVGQSRNEVLNRVSQKESGVFRSFVRPPE